MSQAELMIGRTVVRTVDFHLGREELEKLVMEHVKRTHRVALRDFKLTVELDYNDGSADVWANVHGEARTEGLAPTRKRKARA